MADDDLTRRLSELRDGPLPPVAFAPPEEIRRRGTARRRRAQAMSGAAAVAVLGAAAVLGASVLGQPAEDRDVIGPATRPPSPTATTSPTAPAQQTLFGYISKIRDTADGTVLELDPAQYYTGEDARAAKSRNGVDPDEPPDYYIDNPDTSVTDYVLGDGLVVVGSQRMTGSPTTAPSTLERLRAVVAEPNPPAFTIVVDDSGRVVRVTEFYVP